MAFRTDQPIIERPLLVSHAEGGCCLEQALRRTGPTPDLWMKCRDEVDQRSRRVPFRVDRNEDDIQTRCIRPECLQPASNITHCSRTDIWAKCLPEEHHAGAAE